MFHNRHDAAVRLVRELQRYRNRQDTIILAVPRGGLPIGEVLSNELNLKLGVILTKKIGNPDNPECAIGAVSLTDEIIDEDLVESDCVSPAYLDAEIARTREILRARYRMYHGSERPLSVAGRTVILTDDGAATGRTLLIAIEMLRREGAAQIIVALPVAPPDTIRLLRSRADELICLLSPDGFRAISDHYVDFTQVEDDEAASIMRKTTKFYRAKRGQTPAQLRK